MLLLLFLVNLFSESANGRAAPGPLPVQDLNSQMAADSCDDINKCRRLFDVVWGCLATIFACTWVSVHPNVPRPDSSALSLFWRRLWMMIVAILAPEFMVGFAARQYFVARRFSKKFKISKRHGFFISMGGFVSRSNHQPIVTSHQLDGVPEYLAEIQAVREQDIKDKSKGDALSKGVAVAQQIWFTTQCLARVHQHLPVTQLELVTLAFAVVNIFISLLWLRKPLDVEEPLRVGPEEELWASTVILPKTTFFGWIWGSMTGIYPNYHPEGSTSTPVPSFWSSDWADGITRWKSYEDLPDPALLMECMVGAAFGAIHAAAWRAHFPTTEERWMWRFCSSVVAVLPFFGYPIASHRHIVRGAFAMFKQAAFFCLSIYIIARTILIVLAFAAFRSLPPGTFVDVNWSVYIPHL
ncbi:hypothetical protein C8F01DRAFT_1237260 [Mycena amicta]|nr:hypothetical protein C8F01DRAFT_1237260 [Mycena amicta]